MAVLPIKLVGEEVLRTKARPVEQFDAQLSKLFDDMLDTMYDAPGIGLAGPQVGISRRIIVVDIGDGPLRVANPKIVEQEGSELGPEGCLSIPGIYGDVVRFAKILVRGQDEFGRAVKIPADGLLARVFQHEIDHLDGRLFTDLGNNFRWGSGSSQDEDDEDDEDFDEEEGPEEE